MSVGLGPPATVPLHPRSRRRSGHHETTLCADCVAKLFLAFRRAANWRPEQVQHGGAYSIISWASSGSGASMTRQWRDSGANQDQTRFFRIDGNRLTLRTPEIVSAVRPGQKAVATITFERQH